MTDSPVHMTLCYLIRSADRGREVCLAMKKRGLGQGYWNGVGGKIRPGESTESAAKREADEEIGVVPQTLRTVGHLDFTLPRPPGNAHVTVFFSESWNGEPRETDEMRPQWFPAGDLPLDAMWPSDAFWLREVLDGQCVRGRFTFDGHDRVIAHDVDIVPTLDGEPNP